MHAKNEQGGGVLKKPAPMRTLPLPAAFRAFVAVILCMGLMIPMTLSSGKAYAATGSGWDEYVKIREQVLPDYNHGTIQISSEAAQDNVIELKVGETATITVTPYQHVQYEGCRMWNKPCPTVCDEMFEEYGMEGACFEKGKGCICTKTPSLETAEVSASSTKEDVASVSAVVADSSLSASSGVGKTNTGSVTIEAKAEGETEVTVGVDGLYFWYPAEQTYTVTVASDEASLPAGASIVADQSKQLRQSSATGTVYADMENATAAWKEAVTKVSVKAVDGSDAGTVTVLDPSQYSIDAEKGRITFTRTDEAPVFSVALGEGEPYTETNRWGETITSIPSPRTTRSRSRLRASRPPWARCCSTRAATTSSRSSWTRTGTKTRLTTGRSSRSTRARTSRRWPKFHNGSSQCGMTGFRTFSGMGVPVRTLLEQAGVTVGTTDAFEIDVTDHYGVNTHNYSSLLGGDRYFFQSIYDDQEVKDTSSSCSPTTKPGLPSSCANPWPRRRSRMVRPSSP